MKRLFFHFLVSLLVGFTFLAIPRAVRAQNLPTAPHIQVRLISSVTGAGRPKTITAGVEMKLPPGWDTYWRTPGETGLPPVFDWQGSQNLRSAKVLWPAPTRYVSFGIQYFGYSDDVVFPIMVVPRTSGAAVGLHLNLHFLVCKGICVPQQRTLTLEIPAGEAKTNVNKPLLAAALKNIPSDAGRNMFSIKRVWLARSGKKVFFHAEGHVRTAPKQHADLFIETQSGVSFGKPRFTYNSRTQKLEMRAPLRTGNTIRELERKLNGTPVTLTYVSGNTAYERHVPFSDMQRIHTLHVNLKILLYALLGVLVVGVIVLKIKK